MHGGPWRRLFCAQGGHTAGRRRRKREDHSEARQARLSLHNVDPYQWWIEEHALPPGVLTELPAKSALAQDPELRELEYGWYIEAAITHEAWAEYHLQRVLAEEIGGEDEAKLVVKPDCPIACRWIPAFPKLNDEFIGYDMSLPHYNQETSRVECSDWEGLAAWKADVDLAVSRLSRDERLLFRSALATDPDLMFSQLARQLGIRDIREVIAAVRELNIKVRGWADQKGIACPLDGACSRNCDRGRRG